MAAKSINAIEARIKKTRQHLSKAYARMFHYTAGTNSFLKAVEDKDRYDERLDDDLAELFALVRKCLNPGVGAGS